MRAMHLADQISVALPGWAPPALIGAVISAFVAVLLWYLNVRREPTKRITWEARTQSSIVSIDPEFRQQVDISYAGKNVSDLCAIKFKLRNTGNRVIKDHKIRFHFPGDSEVLEARFSPHPEQELNASLLQTSTDKTVEPGELSCSIGHLEAGQEVSLEILAAGNEAKDWTAHSHNTEGDVQFREKSTERTTSDFQIITWFLALTLTLGALPSIIEAFAPELFSAQAEAIMRVVIFAALLALTPNTLRSILRELRKARSTDTSTIHVSGDRSSVIYNAQSASLGTARITQAPQETETHTSA
ncbi:hypothetical protein [Streptomyces sp. NRRL F-5755]|uniref:hypothetical protein n=1 Tax=Streptomyces sp. NRRL F-5755 TaxID=1519475 RepID=UPI000A7DA1C2|nr:hypothetical protein [Streptomyces sp. NRRL F-5755]